VAANEGDAMTEAEWGTSTDLSAMLDAVRLRASDRKLRLFACACCERIADRLEDAGSRSALAAVRRAADGRADEAELTREAVAARQAMAAIGRRVIVTAFGEDEYLRYQQRARLLSSGPGDAVLLAAEANPWFQAAHAVAHAAGPIFPAYAFNAAQLAAEAAARTGASRHAAEYRAAFDRERVAQCGLLRDLFCHVSRPVDLLAAWRTPMVVALAESIYDDGAFDPLPILADALEDAGCDNADILNHCRQPGVHVRGCWVVDLLLGKE
jgi:hypothetical protein